MGLDIHRLDNFFNPLHRDFHVVVGAERMNVFRRVIFFADTLVRIRAFQTSIEIPAGVHMTIPILTSLLISSDCKSGFVRGRESPRFTRNNGLRDQTISSVKGH